MKGSRMGDRGWVKAIFRLSVGRLFVVGLLVVLSIAGAALAHDADGDWVAQRAGQLSLSEAPTLREPTQDKSSPQPDVNTDGKGMAVHACGGDIRL
jgi:hypothetical protein